MSKSVHFDNLKRPALNSPQAEIEVEGVRVDLHQKLRMVGMTYGIEPTSATLGWAAVQEIAVIRSGQALPVCGLALHFSGITRFEVSFQSEPPGALEYFEYRHDPEPTLIFFFEGGTVRVSPQSCRAELIPESESEADTGLVQ